MYQTGFQIPVQNSDPHLLTHGGKLEKKKENI